MDINSFFYDINAVVGLFSIILGAAGIAIASFATRATMEKANEASQKIIKTILIEEKADREISKKQEFAVKPSLVAWLLAGQHRAPFFISKHPPRRIVNQKVCIGSKSRHL